MSRYIPSLLLLLLSVVLTQRTLPGRNPLMSGRFIYRAQPEDEQMWINYFNLLDIPLTEELLGQGKQLSSQPSPNHSYHQTATRRPSGFPGTEAG